MKKTLFIILILSLLSCEMEETPNLVIGNHFSTGWLYVIDLITDEIIVSESLSIFCDKELFLNTGFYKARLVADFGDDPTQQDRTIIIMINSVYCQIKILFKL